MADPQKDSGKAEADAEEEVEGEVDSADTEDEDDTEDAEEEGEDDDEEPPKRKSPQDYYQERQDKKKAKGESKEEDDDSVDRKIEGRIKPLEKAIRSQIDEGELRELLRDHPEAKKFEKSIRKYMVHEAWSQVPVEGIYFYLAGKKNGLNATKEKADADEKANRGRMGGHGRRPSEEGTGDVPDVTNMSDKQVEELIQKSRMRKL